MSAVIRFDRGLGAWITSNLDRGCAPAALLDEMVKQRMDAAAARIIVDAFVTARNTRGPVPVDSVVLPSDDSQDLAYIYEQPKLADGSRIQLSDRVVRVVTRIEQPRVAVLAGVLDEEDCRQLIELARPRLKPSTVVDPKTGREVVASYRTSLGMFFHLQENDHIAMLDRRVSQIMGLPVEHGEGLQVLCYPEGALSAPHFDFLLPSNEANRASIGRSGQRVSTLVVYLNDVEEGGETAFPEIRLTVSPQRGHAVYFEYSNSLGQLDYRTLHAGNAVRRGEKWVLTKWMRAQPFRPAGGPVLA